MPLKKPQKFFTEFLNESDARLCKSFRTLLTKFCHLIVIIRNVKWVFIYFLDSLKFNVLYKNTNTHAFVRYIPITVKPV